MAASEEWSLLDERGDTALAFTSVMDIECRNEGEALSYPIEYGSFTNYNKTRKPFSLSLTLGVQGTEAEFSAALRKLDEYRDRAVKLSVLTPAALYESLTLASYTCRRGPDSGAGMLAVSLDLVEVREVETRAAATVISKPKNPTSAGKTHTGRARAEKADNAQGAGGIARQQSGGR
jgi:hypothetical protein